MNQTLIALLLTAATTLGAQTPQTQPSRAKAQPQQQTAQTTEPLRTEADGTVVVNTATLATDVYGFKGRVPVEIHFKKGRITQVKPLPNQETPKYMLLVKPLLEAWKGMTPAQAAEARPDGVTGATFTSEALIRNVQRGAAHARENLNAKGRAGKTRKAGR